MCHLKRCSCLLQWILYWLVSLSISLTSATYYENPEPCYWRDINSTAIPADTTSLEVTRCWDLNPQPGALAHLYQLNKLTIAHTRISEFPNISEVGDTLTNIQFYLNNISYINPDYLAALPKLNVLNLAKNTYLDHIPDVPQLSMLKDISVSGTAFQRIPQLTNAGGSLLHLYLHGIPTLKSIDKNDLLPYPKLQTISITQNNLDKLPDFSFISGTIKVVNLSFGKMSSAPTLHTLAMRTVESLDVSDSPHLGILPTLCHENLGSLTVHVSGSGLKLCDCRNAWMKQAAEAGANIGSVDRNTTCGGLNWHDVTTTQLLSVCTKEQYGNYGKLGYESFCSM